MKSRFKAHKSKPSVALPQEVLLGYIVTNPKGDLLFDHLFQTEEEAKTQADRQAPLSAEDANFCICKVAIIAQGVITQKVQWENIEGDKWKRQ
jgi:hypothetical protein